jgi:BirA family biotin operon repressor/biotin-[acetyl-CoA-carboxylase] ligase
VLPAYAERCATIGGAVSVALPGGGTLDGNAVRVDPDGRLVVESAGEETAVGSGDVVHVRRTA